MANRDNSESSDSGDVRAEDLAGETHEDVGSAAGDDWSDAARTREDVSHSSQHGMDEAAWDNDDEGEVSDATTVDDQLARQLAETHPEDDLDIDIDLDNVVAAAVDDQTEPPSELAAGGGFEDLGPAFPPAEDDIRSDSFPPVGVTAEKPRPPKAPEPAAVVPTQKLGGPSQSEPDDGWGSYNSGGWPSLSTNESDAVSEVAPAKAPERPLPDVAKARPRPAGACVARLIGLVGADKDSELAIRGREARIGRIPSNDIILNDHSVSREHARLLHQGDTFMLVDLRSANGTLVNGKRVDRAAVRSGDEVGFGNTRFRFVEAAEAFRPVDAEGAPSLADSPPGAWARLRASPHFRSVLISASMLFVTLLVTVVILAVRAGDADPQRRQIFQHHLQGVEAFKQRDWLAAETQFSIILGLEPTDERAQQYLVAIGRERQFESQLTAARASRDQSALAQAYAQASSIVDSLYAAEAQSIIRGIEAELDARVARARTTLEAGRPNEALDLLHSVDEVRPGRPDVLALRDRAVQVLVSIADTSASASPRPSDARPPSRDPPRGRSPAERATNLFADGRVDEALRTLDAAGEGREVKSLQGRMDQFNKAYTQALVEHRNKRTEPAIEQLKAAKTMATKVVGSNSRIVGEINRRIADMYYVAGINTMLARRFPGAYRNFQTAIAFAPGYAPAMKQLQVLARKAQELLAEGDQVKHAQPEIARTRWTLVMQIVPSGSEYYGQAKQRLDALP